MKMSAIEKAFKGEGGGSVSDRVRVARAEVMERIAQFVIEHEIDITGSNLATIAEGLTGSKAELSKAFAALEFSGERVTQRWLDSLLRKATGGRKDRADGERMKALEQLMDRMESQLSRFSDVAQSAKDESSEHRGAIDAHIDEISRSEIEGTLRAELDRVIELSKAMVERMNQVERAMERSKVETTMLRDSLDKARLEADIDYLTRLPNRRAFERRLEQATQIAEATGESLSVAICDVDHFKSVNDTHGHDAGDRVLVSVAAMLNSQSSADCFVARHGGEEFVLVYAGADKEEAWRRLDAVRRAQASKRMINRDTGEAFGRITFSAGIAQVAGREDTRAALARADAALYKAKEEGRNRVIAD